MDRVSLERFLAQGLSLQAIGRRLGRHESTVAYWVEKHGLQAANRDRRLPRGALRKADLDQLVQGGASIAEIAEAVDRSKATVRHWLTRFGLKTSNRPGRRPTREARAAKDAGLASMTAECPRHGETEFYLDGRGCYRCKRCRSAAVTRRRRKMKAILVREAGGACSICGYQSTMRALHFHHIEPADKRLELNAKGISLSIETLRAEAQKCVLLCSNCHAEVEDGTASIPASALDGHLPA
jgi:transposase